MSPEQNIFVTNASQPYNRQFQDVGSLRFEKQRCLRCLFLPQKEIEIVMYFAVSNRSCRLAINAVVMTCQRTLKHLHEKSESNSCKSVSYKTRTETRSNVIV